MSKNFDWFEDFVDNYSEKNEEITNSDEEKIESVKGTKKCFSNRSH